MPHIPPRRVPRARNPFGGALPGGITGTSSPGSHTHVEADITDLDKYTQAAADAAFVGIGGDTMTGDLDLTSGDLYLEGNQFTSQATNYHQLHSKTGHLALALGGTGDQNSYYNNDGHRFRLADGSEIGRWSATGLLVRAGKSFRIYDAGNTDYVNWSHDGTDSNMSFVNTTELNITGLANRVKLDAELRMITGAEIRLYDSTDTDFVRLLHNTLDFRIITSSTTRHVSIDGNATGSLIVTMPLGMRLINDVPYEALNNAGSSRIKLMKVTTSDTGSFMPDGDAAAFAGALNVVGALTENGTQVALEVMTTNGDVLYYNSGRQRLAKGSDGQVLTLASGIPSWAAGGGGYTDPLTTDGDILIRDTTTKRLAKGADTEVLTLASGLPVWSAPVTGFADPLTTDGDIMIRDTTTKRLAKGSDTEVLTLASGLPVWSAPTTGVTDHGALTGLADDDHTQYALLAGDEFTGNINIVRANPTYSWEESDGAADNQKWDMRANNEAMLFRILNDAGSVAANYMKVERTGTTVDSVDFPGTALTHAGTAVALATMTTDGDILYYNSGRQRLAKGSDDQVLTLASGIPSWEDAAGGGGGGSITRFDPDANPNSAETEDDEFETTSLDAKWTWVDQNSATVAVADDLARFGLTTNASGVRRIEQTIPAGTTWRIRAKVLFTGPQAAQSHIGIEMQDGTARLLWLGVGWSTTRSIFVFRFLNGTTFSSTAATYTFEGNESHREWTYLELERDGNNLQFRWSKNGLVYEQIHTETIASFITNAPTKFGIFVYKATTAISAEMFCDWFRYKGDLTTQMQGDQVTYSTP